MIDIDPCRAIITHPHNLSFILAELSCNKAVLTIFLGQDTTRTPLYTSEETDKDVLLGILESTLLLRLSEFHQALRNRRSIEFKSLGPEPEEAKKTLLTPTLIKRIKEDLARDHEVVTQLYPPTEEEKPCKEISVPISS